MKKLLFATMLAIAAFTLHAKGPGVDEKVLEAFRKTFKNAENVSWSEKEFTYVVSFKQDEISSRITYDKKGNIVRSLRYYKETSLPLMVLSKIKMRFPDKNIFGVTEESSEMGTYYHVTLEDEKRWTELIADNSGNVWVDKKLKKG